ncbi:MAG: hypothetical protein ACERKU_09665, partial [Nitrospirota bacterium]
DAASKKWVSMNEREKTLNGIGAAFLSILPGMGHLYLGVKRAPVFLICGLALLVVAKFFWPMGWLFYIQLAIFSGVDAFSFGKRGRGLF